MKRFFVRFALLALIPGLPGCATVLSKRQYQVKVDNPSGQTYFSIKDRKSNVVRTGMTPEEVPLDAYAGIFKPAKYKVTFAGQGGSSQTKELNAGVDPWVAGNILLGGFPGLAVDGVTGAMWKLPDRVEGNVPASYVVSDREAGESIARSMTVPKTSMTSGQVPAPENQTIRQATATASETKRR